MAEKKKDEDKVKGGRARAESLTPEQRKEIARRAALMRWGDGTLKATHRGTLSLGGVELQCFVLEDGRRVLAERGVNSVLGRTTGGRDYRERAGADPIFLSPSYLKPFISEELSALAQKRIVFKHSGNVGYGIEATVLPQVCGVWLDARKAGALGPHQMPTADKAEALLRAFAGVGVIALVDEATGYQEIRDRHALQALLDQYLAKEFAAWAKRFPDDFYKEMFRLRKWEWRGMKVNRPQCVANYTNDLVYERLAPGILKELEERNPIDSGRRKVKHHQWLTTDVGNPALSQHLHTVVNFMRASKNWDQFKSLLDAAMPRKGDTLILPGIQ